MKRWSLRAQLTLWAALLVAAILLVVSGGVAVYLRHQEVVELDAQFRLIGTHFLAEYRASGARPAWVTPRLVQSLIAETASEGWFIEILGSAGQPLYRSRNLAGRSLAGAPPGLSDFELGTDGVRAGVFPADGVTLYVAEDLDELNELSSSLLIAVAIVFPAALGLIFFGARWLAARALAPIADLTAAAERVTAQRLGEHLPVPPTGRASARRWRFGGRVALTHRLAAPAPDGTECRPYPAPPIFSPILCKKRLIFAPPQREAGPLRVAEEVRGVFVQKRAHLVAGLRRDEPRFFRHRRRAQHEPGGKRRGHPAARREFFEQREKGVEAQWRARARSWRRARAPHRDPPAAAEKRAESDRHPGS